MGSLTGSVVGYDPVDGRYNAPSEHLALRGEYLITTVDGPVSCQPAFERYAALCKKYTPEVIEATCWIPREQVEKAADMIWHSRPVSYYAYSGHEHHANTTETARAMAMVYALTGSFDAPGGNVLLPAVPSQLNGRRGFAFGKASCSGDWFCRTTARTRALEPRLALRISTALFWKATLIRIRELIGFGTNLLLARADPVRGRAALAALDFYAHADLFMTPTAALADIVLPVASCFESRSSQDWI